MRVRVTNRKALLARFAGRPGETGAVSVQSIYVTWTWKVPTCALANLCGRSWDAGAGCTLRRGFDTRRPIQSSRKEDAHLTDQDSMDDVLILPWQPGACRYCATVHGPADPHDKNSLYYQHRFRTDHGRYPTWADAMEHCSEITKAHYRALLAERGINADGK